MSGSVCMYEPCHNHEPCRNHQRFVSNIDKSFFPQKKTYKTDIQFKQKKGSFRKKNLQYKDSKNVSTASTLHRFKQRWERDRESLCVCVYLWTFRPNYGARTYKPAYIRTYVRGCIYVDTYVHTYIHTYMHAHIHTYIHACTHTNIHKCMHTNIHT